MSGFNTKRVLVIGGSSGIGMATANAFAAAGAHVTIASRNREKVDLAAGHIGQGCQAEVLDLRQDSEVRTFFDDRQPWDHVVVTAAETPTGAVRQLPLADAYEAMHSKFWGAYRVARAVRLAEGGSLTLVSGFLAVRPRKGAALQGAINAAIEALTKGLALELAPSRVNAVSPGLVDTPLLDRYPAATRSALLANAQATLPVQRVGQADDVARAILYLAGEGYSTGSVVVVDGGGSIA